MLCKSRIIQISAASRAIQITPIGKHLDRADHINEAIYLSAPKYLHHKRGV